MVDYKEFAQSVKAKYPQYANVDDRELAEKMIAKYPQYSNKVTFETKKGIDLTPSNVLRNIGASPTALVKSLVTGRDFPSVQKEIIERDKELSGKVGKFKDFLVDASVYSKLPMANVAKGGGFGASVVNNALTGAGQGAVIGGLEGLKDEASLESVAKGATTGALVGGSIGGAVPVVAIGAQKVIENPRFQKGVSKTIEALTSSPEKYNQLALENELAGNSIFKGKWDVDTAYQPIERELVAAKNRLANKNDYKKVFQGLGQSVREKLQANIKPDEYFATEYNKIGNQALNAINNLQENAGRAVGEAVTKLPPKAEIPTSELKKIMDKLYDSYSVSERPDLNVAFNKGSVLYDKVDDWLNNESRLNALKEGIESRLNSNELASTVFNKEAENEAFDILANATGKNANWLKSQLKSDSNAKGMGKRREFIEKQLDKVDDKLDLNAIKGQYKNYDTSGLAYENAYGNDVVGKGEEIARKALDDINNRNFYMETLTPLERDLVTAENSYNSLLRNALNNKMPTDNYSKLTDDFMNIIKDFPDDIQRDYVAKFGSDLETISQIKNIETNPMTSAKELKDILYNISEETNWKDLPTSIRNELVERLYGAFNEPLRKMSPDLATANDNFIRIKDLIKNTGGLNAFTIGSKLENFGSKAQIESGASNAFKELNDKLSPEMQFLPDVKKLQSMQKAQNQLQSDISQGVLNDLSRLENAPFATQEAVRRIAPEEVAFMEKTLKQKAINEDLLKKIGSSAYERNPRLLSNVNDLGRENALRELQERSGVKFMPALEKIRAREALENIFPGQGGGSGSGQGFGNLLRTSLIGGLPTASMISHNPALLFGLGLVSPKVMGQGTIKNLGTIYRNLGRNLPKGLIPALYGTMQE